MLSYWQILVYDGVEVRYERIIGRGQIGPNRLEHLLRALVAKYALDDDEIVASYATKGTTISQEHLSVTTASHGTFMVTCGDSSHHAAAIALDENKQPVILSFSKSP